VAGESSKNTWIQSYAPENALKGRRPEELPDHGPMQTTTPALRQRPDQKSEVDADGDQQLTKGRQPCQHCSEGGWIASKQQQKWYSQKAKGIIHQHCPGDKIRKSECRPHIDGQTDCESRLMRFVNNFLMGE
jgi:hypothetical protein